MVDREIQQAEKLAVQEHRMKLLEDQVEAINTKLDDLLQLRNKGMGAFWLATSLLGTGLVGAIAMAVNWFKGY